MACRNRISGSIRPEQLLRLLGLVLLASIPAAFAFATELAAGRHLSARSACPDIVEISRAADSALREFDAIVIGETHGTNEVPRDFLAFVCQALATGKKIYVGLEYPMDAVDAARHVRRVRDSPGANNALAHSGFWRLSRDGRSSASSAKMLRHLLELEETGLLKVVGFDMRGSGLAAFGDAASDSLFDASALHAKWSRIFMILTGHGHAAFSSGSNSLSNSLANQGLNVLHLEYIHSGGTAWVCRSGKCGETQMPARGACSRTGIMDFKVESLGRNRAYARHCVGNITHSAPELANWSQ